MMVIEDFPLRGKSVKLHVHRRHWTDKQTGDSELSIDEVCLPKGELSTLVTSKAGEGQKKSIVAIAEGTKTEGLFSNFKSFKNSFV